MGIKIRKDKKMTIQQIIVMVGLFSIIAIYVYRGAWQPWIQKKQNRVNPQDSEPIQNHTNENAK